MEQHQTRSAGRAAKTFLHLLWLLIYAASAAGAVLLAAASFYDGRTGKGVFYSLLALLFAAAGVFTVLMPAGALRTVLRVVCIVLGLLLVILPTLAAFVGYHVIFHVRSDPNPAYETDYMSFAGLEREKCTFTSTSGVPLAGYVYKNRNAVPLDAVLVLAHGYQSGGHGAYEPCIARFAAAGYTVFAYDATAHGNSGGKGIGGMPRGVRDLSCAIEYVNTREDCRGKPIYLFGHSWGGYSVLNVLNLHPEVKAVVSVSGFDRSPDLLEAHLGRYFGYVKQYVIAAEYLTHGHLAFRSAVSGFRNSDARVMIVHSTDDAMVPMQYSVDRYKALIGEDKRIVYRLYDDRGHAPYVGGEAVKDALVKGIDENLFRDILAFFAEE